MVHETSTFSEQHAQEIERKFWESFDNMVREDLAHIHINTPWGQDLEDAFSGELEDDTDFPC